MMAYAATLLLGLALIWIAWAPGALDPYWLIAGAFGLALGFALALSMRAIDRETAPYLHAPQAALGAGAGWRRIAARAFDVARRAFAAEPRLRPALLRLKAPPAARARFAGAVARTPGAVLVEVEDESLLVHVLVEDEAQEAALRALDRSGSV